MLGFSSKFTEFPAFFSTSMVQILFILQLLLQRSGVTSIPLQERPMKIGCYLLFLLYFSLDKDEYSKFSKV